ncbi:MAG: DUF5320 domain-containing protein [Desulfatitalea sp.]|nr:DUF5320 domain-containing protein [Desulfatitalea sp.]NNK01640.1 DUF5320 domain-containing protein [Desulfatitalea sp.]
MPGFDRKGPAGQGPATGRGFGYCRTVASGAPDGAWGNRLMQGVRRRCRAFGSGFGRYAGFSGGGRGRFPAGDETAGPVVNVRPNIGGRRGGWGGGR